MLATARSSLAGATTRPIAIADASAARSGEAAMVVAVSASGSMGSPSTVAGRCSNSDKSTTTPPDTPSLEDGTGEAGAEATSALEVGVGVVALGATGRLVGPLAPQAPDTMATNASAAPARHGRPGVEATRLR